MPFRSTARAAAAWLNDRLGLTALRYAVPTHANPIWYTPGGITVAGILVLIITGVWMGQYYDPDPAGAYQDPGPSRWSTPEAARATPDRSHVTSLPV